MEEMLVKVRNLLLVVLVVCVCLCLDLLDARQRLRLELLHAAHFRLSVGNLGVGFVCHGVNLELMLSGFVLNGSNSVDCLVVLLLVMCGSVVGVF